MKTKLLIVSCISLAISACNPGQPIDSAATGSDFAVKGFAAPMSESEFDALAPGEQYRIANKLMSTLYKGVAVDAFFDLSAGLKSPVRKDQADTLSDIRMRLGQPLDTETRYRIDRLIEGDPDAVDVNGDPEPLEPRYAFNNNRPKQMPLARITEYPLSKDMFSQWMALHLTNTILFSPAEEIDSADITDVQNLFRRLELAIKNDTSVRAIVSTHQRSVENWRRFRSPEDNTREMIEIYLGLFDRDDDVPKASQVCRDLYLTDEAAGYKLAYTDYPNDEPQLVLGQYVLNCNDFYDLIASHPLLIPRVISVLVDYFFEGRSTEDRTQLVASIAAGNPETFEEIFTAILFSREYLMNTERARSFEENFMATAARLQWEARGDVFMGMTTGRGGSSRAEMAEMGWPTMSLKLGRLNGIPLDSLSFANYHKGFRELLLLDKYRWGVPMGMIKPESPWPEVPEALDDNADDEERAQYREDLENYNADLATLTPPERALYDEALAEWNEEMLVYRRVEALDVDELVDYLFLSVAERKALNIERAGLIQIFDVNGYLKTIDDEKFVLPWHRDELARLVLDYLSRLPEIYYHKKANLGA
ncbi:MAG TPA: hypothetical protein DD979_14205 [Gammaproteobacteria bacterium]|jgi:hypothetical protein|nr:hypothetical protein [Gammaproteobacteria bacterium]